MLHDETLTIEASRMDLADEIVDRLAMMEGAVTSILQSEHGGNRTLWGVVWQLQELQREVLRLVAEEEATSKPALA